MKYFNIKRCLLSALLMIFCISIASTADAKPRHRHKSKKSKPAAEQQAKKSEIKESTDVIINQAVANPCYSLESNTEWHRLFSEFSKAYQENNFENALAFTEQLKEICAASPVLNYSIATTHRELKNDKEALKYYKQAIENTKQFSVSDELLTKFWFARYELENKDVICRQTDLDACNAQNIQLQTDLTKAKDDIILRDNALSEQHRRDAVIMWTGAGIGIAGIVGIAVGGVLLGIDNSLIDYQSTTNDNNLLTVKTRINKTYRPALATLSVGIGLAVAGAVMTGIGGYHYTHPISDDVAASWNISPTNFDLGLQF